TIKRIIGKAEDWPAPGNLYVNGLEVEEIEILRPPEDRLSRDVSLEQVPLDGAARIAWLNLQGERNRVEPQPWFFLAKQLEQKGQTQEAKRAIFELRRHQSNAQWKKHPLLRRFAILFGRLEEQPLRILYPILLLTLLSGALFLHYDAHFAET